MDTAQPFAAAETDPNAQLANAADAFKTATSPPAARDELGQFAAKAAPEPEEEPEPAPQADDDVLDDEPEGDQEDEQEAAQEAQPMPPSWPADEAEHWESLPPETQSYLAKREGEREAAVNAKFQESANARKAAEAVQAQANANREQYAQAIDVVLAAIQGDKPDPRAYGAGTGQYDRESYDLAVLQYEENQSLYAQLFQQREAIQTQAQQEAEASRLAAKQERDAVYEPKLLADMVELTDPAKAEPMLRGLFSYAIEQGIPADTFDPTNLNRIEAAELHVLWKAQQYDKLRSVKTAPPPKPVSPVVRPGVSSPRSAQKNAQRTKAFDRLARDGSVENGAAVFKHFLR